MALKTTITKNIPSNSIDTFQAANDSFISLIMDDSFEINQLPQPNVVIVADKTLEISFIE